MYVTSPVDFTGADDIITNLAKQREPGIQIIECTPQSLIITLIDYYLDLAIKFPQSLGILLNRVSTVV